MWTLTRWERFAPLKRWDCGGRGRRFAARFSNRAVWCSEKRVRIIASRRAQEHWSVKSPNNFIEPSWKAQYTSRCSERRMRRLCMSRQVRTALVQIVIPFVRNVRKRFVGHRTGSSISRDSSCTRDRPLTDSFMKRQTAAKRGSLRFSTVTLRQRQGGRGNVLQYGRCTRHAFAAALIR